MPPWFKPELFLSEQFDSEAAIRDMRRFVRLICGLLPCVPDLAAHLSGRRPLQVPLEALSAELEAQLGRLKTKVCWQAQTAYLAALHLE